MSASKKIKMVMLIKDLKVGELAKKIDKNPRILSNNLYRDSMSFKEFEKIANALNCDIVLQDKDTGVIYQDK